MKKNQRTWKRNAWKPTRRGEIYCAPACGGGCTIAEHDGARSTGRMIAMVMGRGWKVRLNENLGRHWAVVSPCGRIKLSGEYKSNNPKWFSALLGEKDSPGGRWHETSRSPRAAVRKVIAAAKSDLAKLSAFIEGL